MPRYKAANAPEPSMDELDGLCAIGPISLWLEQNPAGAVLRAIHNTSLHAYMVTI